MGISWLITTYLAPQVIAMLSSFEHDGDAWISLFESMKRREVAEDEKEPDSFAKELLKRLRDYYLKKSEQNSPTASGNNQPQGRRGRRRLAGSHTGNTD